MRKKVVIALIAASLCSLPVYADEKDDRIAKLEAQIEEMQTTIDDLQAQLDAYAESETASQSSDQDVYEIGDTWEVSGQWRLTVNSVEEMTERNEYADTDPAAVYLISYTYENIGYEDANGIMDGLFIDLSEGIVDAAKKMGYSYPGDLVDYPQEVPVGASCDAQSCIGVDNAGDFEIHFSSYDGNSVEQSAVFSFSVE